MMSSMRGAARYGLDEEAAFQAHVRREPCTVVLFRGRQCPYSASLEQEFQAMAESDEAWSFAVRECHSGDAGEVNRRYAIDVTPTIVVYDRGREKRRLEARPAVGLPRHRVKTWLDDLDGAG